MSGSLARQIVQTGILQLRSSFSKIMAYPIFTPVKYPLGIIVLDCVYSCLCSISFPSVISVIIYVSTTEPLLWLHLILDNFFRPPPEHLTNIHRQLYPRSRPWKAIASYTSMGGRFRLYYISGFGAVNSLLTSCILCNEMVYICYSALFCHMHATSEVLHISFLSRPVQS